MAQLGLPGPDITPEVPRTVGVIDTPGCVMLSTCASASRRSPPKCHCAGSLRTYIPVNTAPDG